jgi:hypothetical protein
MPIAGTGQRSGKLHVTLTHLRGSRERIYSQEVCFCARKFWISTVFTRGYFMAQPSHITPAQMLTQPKSWLARKWKLVLALFVVLLLLGIAGMFVIYSPIMSSTRG